MHSRARSKTELRSSCDAKKKNKDGLVGRLLGGFAPSITPTRG